jgi:hypothetical protein
MAVMRASLAPRCLLLLALVLSQWLALAHDFKHGASASSDVRCEFCVHGGGFGDALLPTLPITALPVARYEVVAARPTLARPPQLAPTPPIRGPPVSVV